MELTFEDDFELNAVFDGNIDHMSFYVICSEITKNSHSFIDSNVTIKFNGGENDYTFTAKILKKSDRKDAFNEAMELRVITPFKATPRRENFRIDISISVKIHGYSDDFKLFNSSGWIGDAVTSDVSKNGIRLFSDQPLEGKPGTLYTLEFSLRKGIIYFIPAKLMRNQKNTATRSYGFDYGFVFDFSSMPEKQEKLFLDIMEYKLKGRL